MTTANAILSDEQGALLTAALNRIVPAEGDIPGAGDLGIADFVAGVAAADAGKRRRFLDGLRRIELVAAGQGASFSDLPDAAQTAVLQAVSEAAPDFFQELVTQTYRGYYTSQAVFDRLQYRAPNRADYAPRPFDETLLEPVRARGQMWTPV